MAPFVTKAASVKHEKKQRSRGGTRERGARRKTNEERPACHRTPGRTPHRPSDHNKCLGRTLSPLPSGRLVLLFPRDPVASLSIFLRPPTNCSEPPSIMATVSQSTASLSSSGKSSHHNRPGDESKGAGSMAEPNDVEKLSPSLPPAGPPQPNEKDLYKPKSPRFWLTLLCNFMALFLVALDRTIIATAVPRISDEFNALGDIGWYGSAYMLTTSCAQLVYGRIYKFYDMKWSVSSSRY